MDGEAYDKLYGEMTTFYGRDREEKGTDSKKFVDYENYVRCHQYEEYEYILRKDGNWYVKQHDNDYELLAPALAKCNIEECVA